MVHTEFGCSREVLVSSTWLAHHCRSFWGVCGGLLNWKQRVIREIVACQNVQFTLHIILCLINTSVCSTSLKLSSTSSSWLMWEIVVSIVRNIQNISSILLLCKLNIVWGYHAYMTVGIPMKVAHCNKAWRIWFNLCLDQYSLGYITICHLRDDSSPSCRCGSFAWHSWLTESWTQIKQIYIWLLENN